MKRAALGLVLAAAACGEMQDQDRVDPLEPSVVFSDGRGSRDLVPGVVSREAAVDESTPERSPWPVTRELLERGRERYDIFCAVCHDRTGGGGGMIVLRGFDRPRSFADATQRALGDAALHDVIAYGAQTMPSFRAQLGTRDRWAVVAYVRALQLARGATVADLPADVRVRLEAEPR